MSPPITFTLDLEDHRPSPTWEARYPSCTMRLLDHLDERNITATVFVVGRLGERSPDLVREIAARGHEVGLHSFEHWALFSCSPTTFAERTRRSKELIEDLTGQPVDGFRSPAGTLIPATLWATERLAEVGFRYSASVLPMQTYGVGFPGCPPEPFRWPSGLIEAPCPGLGIGTFGLPLMGGTFLRVLPMPLIRAGARRLSPGAVPWAYLHPYDLDTLERFWVVPEVHLWGSVLLWINRGRMLAKLDRLPEGRWGDPLGERLAKLEADDLIVEWSPSSAPLAGGNRGDVAGGLGDRVAKVLRRESQRRELAEPEHLRAGMLVEGASTAG